MASNLVFKSNLPQVLKRMNASCIAFLHEAAGEIESQARVNTRVDSAQTKNSWTYRVDERKLTATIGNPLENAIWEELGTGQYALGGNGRRTAWRFKNRHGRWVRTVGKRPSRAFYKAYRATEPRIKRRLGQRLRGM